MKGEDTKFGRRRERGLRALRSGRRGELWAAVWLQLRGWRLVARNLATPLGEIDLIVRRGAILAFVEVKRRPSLAEGAEAIGWRQRARIVRAAAWFLALRPELARLEPRFDALLLAPGRLPRHLPDAWRQRA